MAGGPVEGAEFTGPLSGKAGLIITVLGRNRQRSSASSPSENSSQAWNLADTPPGKDRIRILAALVATCLIHLGIVFLTPEDGFIKPPEERTPRNPAYEVALVPPEPEDQQFVQTNPDVPQNEPDETRNFANRRQQAAQEEPEDRDFPDGATLCAKCHTKAMVQLDGCLTCLNCGESKCG